MASNRTDSSWFFHGPRIAPFFSRTYALGGLGGTPYVQRQAGGWGTNAFGTTEWNGGARIVAGAPQPAPGAVTGTGLVRSVTIAETAKPALVTGTGAVQTVAIMPVQPAVLVGVGAVQTPTIVGATGVNTWPPLMGLFTALPIS